MKAERWQRLEKVYSQAVEIEPALRLAFLTAACGGDDELLREVHSLLTYKDEAEGFFQEHAIDVAARLIEDQSTPAVARALRTFSR